MRVDEQEENIEQSKIKITVTPGQARSDVKVISVEGVLDAVTTAEVEKVIIPLIEEGMNLILDCSSLSYLNSTGLSFLMKCHIQIRRRKGSFKLVNPNQLINDVVKTCGVWNFLEIYASLKEAMRSVPKK